MDDKINKDLLLNIIGNLKKRPPRDPKRIDKVLELLRTYWEKNSDLRLGQILVNFTDQGKDSFYLEDDDLIIKLLTELKKIDD